MQPEPTLWGWNLSYVANVTELVGFVLTIGGLIATFFAAMASKSAAEQAQQAANDARSSLLKVDAIAGLSGIINELESIKRLHRAGNWEGMPERYGTQRRTLISVRGSNVILNAEQRKVLQSGIQQLSVMEKLVETHLVSRPQGANPPDAAKLNRIISKMADDLTQLLTELKLAGDHYE